MVRARNKISAKSFSVNPTLEPGRKGHIFHLVPQGRIRTSGTKCGCFAGTITKGEYFQRNWP